MSNLTERQSQVLDLIRRYIEDTGYPPTRADICLLYTSPSPRD